MKDEDKSKNDNDSQKTDKVAIGCSVFPIAIISIIFLIVMFGSSKNDNDTTDNIPYTVNNSFDYVRDGQTCQLYNVITDGELTDDDLQTIYYDIKQNDDSYLFYTIKFYSSKSNVTTVNSYASIDDEISTDVVRENLEQKKRKK